MIRVLLADDHSALLESMQFMLDRELDIKVVATAATVAEAKSKISGIDVAVVDLHLPDGSGVELVKAAREANPKGSVIVLSASTDRADMARAAEAGACGFLHKSSSIDEIVAAVRKTHGGESLFPVDEIVELFRMADHQKEAQRTVDIAIGRLTRRELEVLQYLSEGNSLKETADKLTIAFETARTHMVNILSKLNVHSQMQALIFAIRHGLVEIG